VLATGSPDPGGGSLLTAIDPDTLADVPGLEPLQLPPCVSSLAVQPAGNLAALATAAARRGPRCADPGSLNLRVLDLNAWSLAAPLNLPGTSTDAALTLDAMGRALAWTADGKSLYAVTADPSEQRRLWLVDASGATPSVSVPLDFLPARLDVSPSGSALFVLGGRTADNTRQGAAVPGSAFVAIYDPKTLVERIRVPLSGLSLGLPESRQGSLTPGVAMAPDGSRYYVVHADRPVLDVVDTRAPRLERLERSVSLRDSISQVGTRSAWLGVSPDGGRLYLSHPAQALADDLGLQVVDTHTWQVQTLDPIAQRLGTSLDGRWLFQLDPPAWNRPGAEPPQQRSPRDLAGARLSVLEPSSLTQVATLWRDQLDTGFGQYGGDRLYVIQLELRQARGGAQGTLIGYDTTTWQEIARRRLDAGGALVTTAPLW
jgi:hypothetical protein